jgi:hypothetical protein
MKAYMYQCKSSSASDNELELAAQDEDVLLAEKPSFKFIKLRGVATKVQLFKQNYFLR